MNKVKKIIKSYYEDFKVIKNTSLFKTLIIIAAFAFPLLIEKYHYTNEIFNFYRYMIFLLGSLFIAFHFVFDIKTMYEYMYKKRYYIGVGLFAFLVIFQYHGSSISLMNDSIEPSNKVDYAGSLVGYGNAIRSDEWAGFTEMVLSQGVKKNNFNVVNKTFMGGNENNYRVDLFPGLPTKSFNAILFPKRIGFLFLPIENAFSWYWYIEYFLLFFATFEFGMLIFKKNKFWSLICAVSVTFAGAVQWWDFTNIIYQGMFAIILFDKLLRSEKVWHKVLYAIGIGYFGASFVLTMYPAFAIPFAYFFLGIVIWQLCTIKDEHKVRDVFLTIGITLLTMVCFLAPIILQSIDVYNLMNSTVYPGTRFSSGGAGWQGLFNYVTGVLTPYYDMNNPSELSAFMGLFPLPTIVGIVILIKNRKKWKEDILLPILIVLTILLSIWNFIELPRFISKYSLLYMSTVERCNLVVSFISMILFIYILSNYSNKSKISFNNIVMFVVSIAFVLGTIYINDSVNHFAILRNVLVVCLALVLIIYLFLNLQHNKLTGCLFALIILITGLSVHPINRSLNVIYDKNVAKEIQSIVKEDPDAMWISAYSSIFVPNYALANGAKVLNTINYYPNYNLIDKIDSEHKYEDIWNRFAHIYVEIGKDATSYELMQADYYALKLSNADLCNLNVKYIISYQGDLEEKSNIDVLIDKIYGNDNVFIYKNYCH